MSTSVNGEIIGKRVRKTREKQDLSISKLSELAGVTREYISRLERGERKVICAVSLFKIATVLEVSTNHLISGNDDTNIKQRLNVLSYRVDELLRQADK